MVGTLYKAHLIVDRPNRLFKGLPKKFVVWQSHNNEIHDLPKVFDSLAHSENCAHQAIAHKKRPLFGTQFHPEAVVEEWKKS